MQGKLFWLFDLSVLKVLPLLKAFVEKTITIQRKFAKITKLFSHVALFVTLIFKVYCDTI